MTEAQIQSVALFQFLALLDQKVSIQATLQSVRDLKKKLNRLVNPPNPDEFESIVVATTKKVLEKNIVKMRKPMPFVVGPNSGWQPPSHLDLGPWREFKGKTSPDQVAAVIWVQVLGFKEENVATGLGVSTGTVRHRMAQGLKTLGQLNSGRKNSKKSTE